MLIFLLISLVLALSQVFVGFLPSGAVLPFGIDPIFLNAVQGLYAFIDVFPPIGVVLQAFLLYVGFRLVLLLLKLILGSRAPIHD